MDELLDLLIRFMEEVGQNFDSLSDEEANEISEFLIETFTQLQNQQRAPNPTPSPAPIGADLLWILAGGQEDAFVNYLRTFPDPSLNSLLKNPPLLRSTIDHLNKTLPQGERGSSEGIPQAPLDSSNIYGFQYDPSSGQLKVRFQSGSIYNYQGVPPGIFRVFQQGAIPAKTTGQNSFGKWWEGKIPSLGAAFYQLIRQGNYPYQRLK
jgi:hypothetical protein